MKRLCLFLISVLFLFIPLLAENGSDPLDRHIRVEKQKKSVYELLNYIGDVSGFYFIYDSKIVDNEKKAKLSSGTCF